MLGVDDRSREILGISLEVPNIVECWAREVCPELVKPVLFANIRKLTMKNAVGQQVPAIRIDLERSLLVHKSSGECFRKNWQLQA